MKAESGRLRFAIKMEKDKRTKSFYITERKKKVKRLAPPILLIRLAKKEKEVT